jgi:hypothetical protein
MIRPPVLIIGAHRSGTTATAHALRLLGLQVGQRVDSHEEPRRLQQVHEDYLGQRGASWHSPDAFLDWIKTPEGRRHCTDYLRENVRNDFARIFGYRKNPRGLWMLARLKMGARWGWKEPRTTLFASSWLEIFPEARFVHVVRDAHAVAKSIRQRELEFRAAGDSPAGRIDNLEYGVRLAKTYVEQGEKLADQTANYRRIQFEDIQAEPNDSLIALADFCQLRFNHPQLEQAVASIRRN